MDTRSLALAEACELLNHNPSIDWMQLTVAVNDQQDVLLGVGWGGLIESTCGGGDSAERFETTHCISLDSMDSCSVNMQMS
jgi:hypothetical protein